MKRLVFAGAALAGGLFALAGLFAPEPEPARPADAVADVNGWIIPAAELEIALEAMARDSRNPLPEDARERALNRLIDEELLFQRAVALDMPRNEPNLRRAAVLAMIEFVISGGALEAEEAELRALFEAERVLFEAEPRLRIDWRISFEGGEAERPPAHPPNRLLSLTELRRFIGPGLVAEIEDLPAGSEIGPIESGDVRQWISVVERADPQPPVFEDHRTRVEALWRERQQEGSLEAYLERLRSDADITLIDPADPAP
jgi:hypothetical protein